MQPTAHGAHGLALRLRINRRVDVQAAGLRLIGAEGVFHLLADFFDEVTVDRVVVRLLRIDV